MYKTGQHTATDFWIIHGASQTANEMIQAPGMSGRPQHIYSHDISVFSHRERDELNSVSYPIIQSIYI